jgi:hypothetical protein
MAGSELGGAATEEVTMSLKAEIGKILEQVGKLPESALTSAVDAKLAAMPRGVRQDWNEQRNNPRCPSGVETHGDGTESDHWCGDWTCF